MATIHPATLPQGKKVYVADDEGEFELTIGEWANEYSLRCVSTRHGEIFVPRASTIVDGRYFWFHTPDGSAGVNVIAAYAP